MQYTMGANKSPYDIRTFTYPTKAFDKVKGGTRYVPKDIEHQERVGICTAIAVTMNARKAENREYSADFQYLMQKKYYDKNWREGSSAFHALKVAKNIGLLPEDEWTATTHADRKLSYTAYMEKLMSIPEAEIERLKTVAEAHQIKAYAKVPVTRDNMALAIDESKAGIITRFVVGKEWWTAPINPLRYANKAISGHLVTTSNFDGGSFRIANSWGPAWADGGTAYFLLNKYAPTEAWRMWFKEEVPEVIEKKLESRESIIGKIVDLLQQVIALVFRLK